MQSVLGIHRDAFVRKTVTGAERHFYERQQIESEAVADFALTPT